MINGKYTTKECAKMYLALCKGKKSLFDEESAASPQITKYISAGLQEMFEKAVNQAREEGYKQGYFEGRADMKKDILKL